MVYDFQSLLKWMIWEKTPLFLETPVCNYMKKKKGLYSSYVQPTKSVDDALHDLFDLSGNPTLEVASDLNGKIMHELVGLSQPPIWEKIRAVGKLDHVLHRKKKTWKVVIQTDPKIGALLCPNFVETHPIFCRPKLGPFKEFNIQIVIDKSPCFTSMHVMRRLPAEKDFSDWLLVDPTWSFLSSKPSQAKKNCYLTVCSWKKSCTWKLPRHSFMIFSSPFFPPMPNAWRIQNTTKRSTSKATLIWILLIG